MQALLQTARGSVETLKLDTIDKPVPKPNEVLIKVHAASVNPVDMKRRFVDIPDVYPVIVGYDVAGIVESVGTEVTRFKQGDRVFGDVLEDSVGVKTTGTMAEYCACRADLLAFIPDGSSFVHAAALPLAGQTSFLALETGGVKESHSVFVTGGAGGVGIHLMQVAKKVFGVTQVATTASVAKADFARKYGADIVVDYKTQDAGEVLKEWADVAIDNTGELDLVRRVVKQGGSIVTIVDHGASGDVTFIMLHADQRKMERVATAWKEGKLIPVIDTVYEMKDCIKAVEHVEGGRSKGKVVVEVAK